MKTRKFSLMGLMAFVVAFCAVLINTAAIDAKSGLQNQQWLYDGSGDPTSPGNYASYTGDLANDCGGQAEVCGIIAPPDGSGNQPVIDSDLAGEIQQGEQTDRVFLQPFPQN